MAEPINVISIARPQQAYLIKLNAEAWAGLQRVAHEGTDGLSITLGKDGSLNIPASPFFGLDSTALSPPIEIHQRDGSSLSLVANASHRLQIPLTSVPTALQDKLRSQTDAAEQARKDRKLQVMEAEPSKRGRGLKERLVPSKPVSRPTTPAIPSRASTPTASTSGSMPVVPLKTRVMQLLALGPKSVKDVVARVGGGQDEVARVLKVVASPVGALYSLLPLQYAKIKVAAWPAYSRAEQMQVKKLATVAFDKMGLGSSADERAAFDAACKTTESTANIQVSIPAPSIPAPSKPLPKALTRTAGMTRSSSMDMAKLKPKPKPIEVAPTNGKRKRDEEVEVRRKPSVIRKLRAEVTPNPDRSSSVPLKASAPDYSSSDEERPSADKLRVRYGELQKEQQRVEDEIRRLRRWLEKIAAGRNVTDGEYVDMERAGEDVKGLVLKMANAQEEMEEISEWFTD